MDENRFVELTAELLKADRRYHRKMLDVMETVNQNAFIPEGSGESRPAAREETNDASQGQQPATRRSRSGQSLLPTAIEFF